MSKLTPETTAQQALSLVAQGKVTMEDYLKWDAERIERIKAEAKAASSTRGRLSVKTSLKGGVSLYGMQRFPVTFSVEQWKRLFSTGKSLVEEHIATNHEAIDVAVAYYATPKGKADIDAQMDAKNRKRLAA